MPPRQKKNAFERDVLAEGQRVDVPFRDGHLATWRFGSTGPTVLLVHGWGGHAGRLTSFVRPLRQAGYSVIAFDAPAHGESGGTRASAPEFAEALTVLSDVYGPFSGVVAHSVGSTATVLALRAGLRVPRIVFLAPASNPDRCWSRFARFWGIPRGVRGAMKRRFEARYGMRWNDLRIGEGPAATDGPLLIVHDRRDVCIPIGESEELVKSWRGSRLIPTAGLGHHRIVHDPLVVAEAVRFLSLPHLRCAPCEALEERIAS